MLGTITHPSHLHSQRGPLHLCELSPWQAGPRAPARGGLRICYMFIVFAWGSGSTLGLAGLVSSPVRCGCAIGAQHLWGQCQGDLGQGGRGGKQEHRFETHALTGHQFSPEYRRALGTFLPLEGAAKSLLYALGCSSHPPHSPEWCHQSLALWAQLLGLHPCPYQLVNRAGVSQQEGLEQSLHLTLNLSLFLWMWRLFLEKKRVEYEEHTWFQSHCAKI